MGFKDLTSFESCFIKFFILCCKLSWLRKSAQSSTNSKPSIALQASLSYMYILYVGNFYISNNYDLKFKVLSSIFLVSINLVKILMRQYCGQWKSSKGILINFETNFIYYTIFHELVQFCFM